MTGDGNQDLWAAFARFDEVYMSALGHLLRLHENDVTPDQLVDRVRWEVAEAVAADYERGAAIVDEVAESVLSGQRFATARLPQRVVALRDAAASLRAHPHELVGGEFLQRFVELWGAVAVAAVCEERDVSREAAA